MRFFTSDEDVERSLRIAPEHINASRRDAFFYEKREPGGFPEKRENRFYRTVYRGIAKR